MTQKFANAARAYLASTVSDSATTVTIDGGGSLFPAITSPEFSRAVLQDANGIEVVLITAHTAASDSFTVTRAQEGTTARSFAAGSVFGIRMTSADADTFAAKVSGPASATNSALAAFDGTTGKLIKNASLTANNVLLGNGTSAVQVVAPGTAGNVLTSNGTTWTSAAGGGSVVQYPQNSRSANYTLVLGDAGKQIFHPSSDTSVRTFTIPANSSVAFPVGTVVLFTVENGGRSINVAITSDSLVFGSGTTGAIAVPPNNTLMCIKVTATKWMANYLYQIGGISSLQAIAVVHNTTPFVSAYPWSGSGFGTKYADPATLPTGAGRGVAFSPAGDAIAVAHTTSPFVSAYPWSVSGLGTKFANPATLPTDTGNGVAFTFNP
jgi:hypothetical protein